MASCRIFVGGSVTNIYDKSRAVPLRISILIYNGPIYTPYRNWVFDVRVTHSPKIWYFTWNTNKDIETKNAHVPGAVASANKFCERKKWKKRIHEFLQKTSEIRDLPIRDFSISDFFTWYFINWQLTGNVFGARKNFSEKKIAMVINTWNCYYLSNSSETICNDK